MLGLPEWVKVNKNWTPAVPYESNNYIIVEIFREQKTRMRKISCYKQVKFTESPLISGIKQTFLKLGKNLMNQVIKDSNHKVLTAIAKEYKIPCDEVLQQLINAGMLGVQTFYRSDGITIENEVYGVTNNIMKDINSSIRSIQDKNVDWLARMTEHVNKLKGYSYPVNAVEKILDSLVVLLEQCHSMQQVHFYNWTYKNSNLPGSSFHTAVEFLVSVLYCIHEQGTYDWKEIGPKLDDTIGGSKRFDGEKQKLIGLIESITQIDAEALGLISLGSLYPLYLAGNLEWFLGDTNHFTTSDTVYSLTNLQLNAIETLSSKAGVLIFTENRAVLLKMQKTGWIKKSNALVLCFDGNLKIGHTSFFIKLSNVVLHKPVFIWVDGDDFGRDFAYKLNAIFKSCRFIGYYNNTLVSFESIDQWVNNKEYYNREQEGVMCGPTQWDQVFR